jgi:hypothetical protein
MNNNQMRVFLKGQKVTVKLWYECGTPLEMSRKEIVIRKPRGCKGQPSSHPWKHWGIQELLKKLLRQK